MERLRTDSPVARRIVRAFLGFIDSVEPAPGIDLEGLDVVRECLQEIFKLDQYSEEYETQPQLLTDLFSSGEKPHGVKPESGHIVGQMSGSDDTSPPNAADPYIAGPSEHQGQQGDPNVAGVSKDELFGQFYSALDCINFFTSTPGGDEDNSQLTKASTFFEDAILEMEKSGNQTINRKNLAETFKSQGNRAMQSKSYSEAVELYTCAIALSEKNAVYYCNRAAAYTRIHKYNEAIEDCKKSIEIDPNYAKAYSREGLAYYELGKYKEAMVLYLKALQLDPNNVSVKENICVTQQRWREEQRQTEGQGQTNGSRHGQQQNAQSAGSRNRAPGVQFPFDISDFVNVITNMSSGAASSQNTNVQPVGSNRQDTPFSSIPTSNAMPIDLSQIINSITGVLGQQGFHAGGPNGNTDSSNEPEIRMDGNISLNLEDLPGDISGIMGSVMEMFSSQSGQTEGHSSGQS